MSHTARRRTKRVELSLLILTPIYPQAVKTLPLAGRSSGSLLPRRLPDFWSVAVSVAKLPPLSGAGAYSSGNCTGLSPVSLLIRQAARPDGTCEQCKYKK